MAEIFTLQPHSITTSKTLNIIQSSLTRGMLTKFSDFIGNTNTEFNLCSISPRTKFQWGDCLTSNYWAADSSCDLSYLPTCIRTPTGTTDMLQPFNMVLTGLHFPSFIFFTWHVKLLEECKAIIGRSRARRKKVDKYWNCTKVLILIFYPPSSKHTVCAYLLW